MANLKGTKTLQNLMKAFAGESQARNRYTMFASVAGKDGHAIIQNIFLETADNERLHAKAFYEQIAKSLDKNEMLAVNINADYPVILGDTLTNLKAAAAGEHEEFAILYSEFAKVAESEGFSDIAFLFNKIGIIEHEHEKRYAALAKALEDGTLYKSNKNEIWKCSKCGHIHEGNTAPNVCPVCAHPQGYFAINTDNY